MFFESGGARLFFSTMGTGPDLVLLHPTPVDHCFWMPVAEKLAECYRITLLDFKGHGRSEAAGGVLSIEGLAEDVVRLLDALGIERAFFAGCSIGSYVLYELWRSAPARIRALALCCGKPQPDAEANRSKRKQTIEGIARNGTVAFFDQTLTTLLTPGYRQREPLKTAELRAMMSRMTAESAVAVQHALMTRPDSVPTVKTISVPVLALAGQEDQASTPEEMAVIHQLLSSSEYHLIPGTGHFAPYEKPDTVAAILESFFGKVSGPDTAISPHQGA
ncbi:MAG TPA: alpha/beta hydrolase [Acidobacteriaceae bacterium]